MSDRNTSSYTQPLLAGNKGEYARYSSEKLRNLKVFPLIHRIKADIEALCDSPLTIPQLESPKLIFLISPLQEKYTKLDNVALVYCLLVCRVHFLDQQASPSPSAYSLAHSRAALCEILAVKVIRKRYDQDPESDETILHLAHCLAASFSPFQGAPQEVLDYHNAVDPLESVSSYPKSNALELAIIGNAKRLVRSMPCQRVIDAIHSGEIVYSPTSFIDLLHDPYKRKPITIYNPETAPILNHHRLIVPRIRHMLEYCHFLILFASYLMVVFTMKPDRINGWEIWLVIYASGFALDKFATVLEHGMNVYVRNLWNSIDLCFCALFVVYLVLRLQDASHTSPFYFAESLNVLACGAIILFPRLAFLVVNNGAIVLGLRVMFVKFVFVCLLALWCFAGFLLAFYLLGAGEYSVSQIAKYMVYTTFGMNGKALAQATNFHPWLGPLLWVVYGGLSSYLLLSCLVAVLSHSFKDVADDETSEVLFKKAVNTLEGIKSDAIFLYQPPFNVPAFIILFPLRYCVSPRWFHKVNVYAARATNAPLLLLIAMWERKYKLFGSRATFSIYKYIRRFLNATTAHHDLQLVFDVPPELQDDLPHNGLLPNPEGDEEEEDEDQDSRGRSHTPVTKHSKLRSQELQREGSRPSPLTRLYGRGTSANSEDVSAVMRKIDSLEEMLSRLEEAIKQSGALS